MAGSRKRFGIVAGTVAAVLVGGGVAVAFWTTSGSGTGTAGVGTGSSVTVEQVGTTTGLTPGGSAKGVDFKILNQSGGPLTVASVAVSISSVTKASGAPAGTCDSTDFSISGTPVTIGQSIPDGATGTTFASSTTGLTISMINKPATNQDACKGATVNLAFAAS